MHRHVGVDSFCATDLVALVLAWRAISRLQYGPLSAAERQRVLGSSSSDLSHWTLTTATMASETMPRMAALVWSCSSFMTDQSLELLFSAVPPTLPISIGARHRSLTDSGRARTCFR